VVGFLARKLAACRNHVQCVLAEGPILPWSSLQREIQILQQMLQLAQPHGVFWGEEAHRWPEINVDSSLASRAVVQSLSLNLQMV
jgi:hypothetical protein